jgi:uncharacterized cupin superfamily protein
VVKVVKSGKINQFNSTRLTTGEVLGCLSDLSGSTGLEKLNIYLETLSPGHRSSPPHYHSDKEEFIFVIEGKPSLYIDGEIVILHPGDAVGFPVHAQKYHMISNNDTVESKILVVSITSKKDVVSYEKE